MDTYLAKPIRAVELFATLERLFPSPGSGAVKPLVPARPRTEAAVDEIRLLHSVDDDRTMVLELAEMFLAEHAGRLETIEAAIAAGDAQALERAAHALKGVLGTLCAESAAASALELEILGREGDLTGSAQSIRTLRSRLEKVAAAFEEIARRDAA
jgi:HPt (histidine-containing phosphotransfer) domain-containing protein